MLAKRIIPCLDVKNGRVVKGVNFVNLRDAGDPVEQAAVYDAEKADELVFLDITASFESRNIMLDVARRTADAVFIPFTVGGGIRSVEDIRAILLAGADKVSINTAAIQHPELISEGATPLRLPVHRGGHRRPARRRRSGASTHTAGATRPSSRPSPGRKRPRQMGAGEILLTSMDADGTQNGYDIALTRAVAEAVSIPGDRIGRRRRRWSTFTQVLTEGKADAALAASLFHNRQLAIADVKAYLRQRGVRGAMTEQRCSAIKWNEQGLVPAIVQEAATGEVLMMAWMNAESLRLCLATGETHFWSRSRRQLWHKGETSGHIQKIKEIRIDCDGDVLLVLVEQTGAACHTGEHSCFYRTYQSEYESRVRSCVRRGFSTDSTARLDTEPHHWRTMPSRRTPILIMQYITSLGHPPPDLDFITDSLAVGGALRSDEQIRALPGLGIGSVVDMRSESQGQRGRA